MEETLIQNWNSVVKSCDTVYHLGDFGFGTKEFISKTFRRLNGTKHFVVGNHDKKSKILMHDNENRTGIQSIKDYNEINVEGQQIILCHYPLLTWNRGHYGSWMLHGHCHSNLDYLNKETRRLDVGVDGVAQYFPISFEQIKEIMDKKVYKVVDHHGKSIDNESVGDV